MNRRYAMTRALLISWVVWAGCAGGETEPALGVAVSASEPVDDNWVPEQGTHILGGDPDGHTETGPAGRSVPDNPYLRVGATPTFRTGFQLSVTPAEMGAHLVAAAGTEVHAGIDAWFIGLVMTEVSSGARIRVTGVDLVKVGDVGILGVQTLAPTTLYTLEYRASNGDGTFADAVDYCGGKGGAIALAGGYDRHRQHTAGPTISFACPDGIAWKCNFWGYVAGNDATADGWKYHQACTGMGNANYCKNGLSFTRELTPIQIRDARLDYGSDGGFELVHPDEPPGDPDRFYIEAGWDDHGFPICLSRIRWSSLPPSPCDDVFPDPRYSNPILHRDAAFCDGLSQADLFARGAVLINGSFAMDDTLHRWKDPSSGDEVLTVRGYFIDRDGDGVADPGSVLPFHVYPGANYSQHVGRGAEGVLLRHLPGSLPEGSMRALYSQNLTSGDRYLSDVGGGRADPAFEGFAFRTSSLTTTEGDPIQGLVPLAGCAWPTAGSGGRDSRVAGQPGGTGCAPMGADLGFVPLP
jgi:hypothetical protein